MNITKKQMAVLDFIKQFIAVNGYSPTVREICYGLGLKSPATVHDHLKKLVSNRLITINPNKSRTIELLVDNEYLRSNNTCIKVPLYENFPFDKNNKSYVDIPKMLLGNLSSSKICALKFKSIIYIIYLDILKNTKYSVILKEDVINIQNYSPDLNDNIVGTIISKIENYLI